MYSNIIMALAKTAPTQAIFYYEEACEKNMKIWKQAKHAIMRALTKVGRFSDALALFDALDDEEQDMFAWTAKIKALGMFGDGVEALEVCILNHDARLGYVQSLSVQSMALTGMEEDEGEQCNAIGERHLKGKMLYGGLQRSDYDIAPKQNAFVCKGCHAVTFAGRGL